MNLWVQAGLCKELSPAIKGFLVKLAGVSFAFVWAVNRGIESLFGEFPNFGNKLPCPFNGLFFEVISKAPVTEHFKKCVVIGIHPHIIKVVMLATGAYALLCVSDTQSGVGTSLLAQENGDKLIHACISEKQVG